MKPQVNKPQRYIILDTNIFQHAGNDSLALQVIVFLKEAVSKGYGISLSQFSLIELVDGASLEKERKRLAAVNGLKQFHVTQGVLLIAGQLGCLYGEDGLDEKQQPERGDKIIGATSLLGNCLIYTTNGRDFPAPYFKEVGRYNLPYQKGGVEVNIMAYLMEPDINATAARINNRYSTTRTQKLVSARENTEV